LSTVIEAASTIYTRRCVHVIYIAIQRIRLWMYIYMYTHTPSYEFPGDIKMLLKGWSRGGPGGFRRRRSLVRIKMRRQKNRHRRGEKRTQETSIYIYIHIHMYMVNRYTHAHLCIHFNAYIRRRRLINKRKVCVREENTHLQ